jgi:O-antigen/teichoic acid export membrane protein
LQPAVAHVDARGQRDRVREIHLVGSVLVAYLSGALLVAVYFYARSFVNLWLPPEFSEAARMMRILMIGTAVLLPQLIGNAILLGINRHRYLFYVLAIEAAAKLLLSFLLIRQYGMLGLAIASIGPQVILYSTVYPWLTCRTLEQPYLKYALKTLQAAITAIAVALPFAIAMERVFPPLNWPTLLADLAVVTGAVAGAGWMIYSKDWKQLRRYRRSADSLPPPTVS